MIKLMPGFPANVIALAGSGHLSHGDYRNVVIPAVEKALKTHAKVRMLYELQSFEGVDPAAAWDDFAVGVGHLTKWERIAVVTDVEWIRTSVDMMRFLMPCPVRTFPLAEKAAAQAWITAAD